MAADAAVIRRKSRRENFLSEAVNMMEDPEDYKPTRPIYGLVGVINDLSHTLNPVN